MKREIKLSGSEISIAELAELIRNLVGFRGGILWDPAKPDGQPRRTLDTTRARMRLGFIAETTFAEGLRETVRWYEAERAKSGTGSLAEPRLASG